MKLEEEIKQRKFQSEFHKLALNVRFTANWLGVREYQVFKRFGISAQQFNVLRILKGQHPHPASLILVKERMLDKESNASRLVDKLHLNGYVIRKQCPEDRRQVDITITGKGIGLLEQINPALEKLYDEIKGGVSAEDALKVNELLDQMRDAISERPGQDN